MELVELVSPHVAMPVIGVVLCAFIVFAFGFRSPVQPPSFQFEEDKRNKKRLKPTKAKASNGHVISEPPVQYTAAKASPSGKESKPAAFPKAKQSETKNNTKKEIKQDFKFERKEKVRKQFQSEEIPFKQNTAAKKEAEDEGEWTTVQVPKKSKKQKPASGGKLKDESLPECAVESEPEVENSPSLEAAAAAAVAVEPVVEDTTGSTQTIKGTKKKIKKDKAEKLKQEQEDKEDIVVTQEVEKVGAEEKKKKKKDKKTSAFNDGGAAAGAAAALPHEAAPASAKSVSKGAEGDLPPASEEVEEDFQLAKTSPKKKKGKSKENIDDKPAKANDAQEKKEMQLLKKNEKKKPEPKDMELSVSSTGSSQAEAQVAAQDQTLKDQHPSLDATVEKGPTSPVSFDEIGDSWQEAAPKSKKKKPRRDN